MTRMALLTHARRLASTTALLGVAGCSLDTGSPNEPKTLYGGTSTSQSVKTNAPTTISVFVLNNYGEPINGATVTFTLTAGTGTLSATTVTSTTAGIAQATYTPTKAGTSVVEVSVPGLKPIPFTIVASD